MNDAALTSQLDAPHPDGATLALYRTRVYRFSTDPRHYVLAEALEEKYALGTPPAPATLQFLKATLDEIRSTGQPLPFNQKIAETEGINVQEELDARAPYAPRPLPEHVPQTLVFIVGAPRSGTSHLYNVLAHTSDYAYFTTASCWAWPVHNLRRRPTRRSFEELDQSVLRVDNKNTRLIPGLVLHECCGILHPGGTVVVVTRPWRERGELIDLPAAVLDAGKQAGFTPTEHNIALLAGLRDGQLIPRPSFFQMKNTRDARRRGVPLHLITHEDVLVFRQPGS
ncbi:hypothetical protein [Streptomyces qinglanensis]|uniref:hypothetical protein n=1 Tax=Streptomyces qinglanensis TaxID=943816 RepID=UPI0037B1AE1D